MRLRGRSLMTLATPALLLSAFTQGAPATGPPVVSSYELDVTLVPDQSRLEGLATVTLKHPGAAADLPAFFLHGELRVESVEGPAGDISFSEDRVLYRRDYSMVANRVTLDDGGRRLPERISIRYGGPFHPSRARSPSDYMRIDDTGAYLRSYGYSLWFPVFLEPSMDDPEVSFPRVIIRTPEDFIPVFVGERVREEVTHGQRSSEWRAMGVQLFDAQLTARPFEVQRFGGHFVYSIRNAADRQAGTEIGRLAAELVELFSAYYGAGRSGGHLHIAQMPEYGDISSGNVVGMSANTWREFATTDWALRTLAHEIVHPYVQVKTSPGSPLRALVIEGFPSYFHLPALATLRGQEFYDNHLDRVQASYLQKRATGKDGRGRPLPPEKPLLEIGEEEIRVYKDRFVLADRVLLFLDHLRRSMGPERFLEFARDLFGSGELRLEELYATIESHLPGGREMARLWLETSDYPESLQRP